MRRTEDGRQTTEDGGQTTEDRGQRTEVRGQRTDDRGQRTEDRGQRTEDRRQRTGTPVEQASHFTGPRERDLRLRRTSPLGSDRQVTRENEL